MSSSPISLTSILSPFASLSEVDSHHDSAAAAAETVQHVSPHMCGLILSAKRACMMVNLKCRLNRVSLWKCTLGFEHASTKLRLLGCSFAAKAAVLLVRGRSATSSTANFSMYTASIVRRVVTGLAAASPEGARDHALRLYSSAKYAEAAAKWRQAIQQGDVPSLSELAWLLAQGREGVESDRKAACELALAGQKLGCMHCSGILAWMSRQYPVPMLGDFDFRMLASQSAAAGSRYSAASLHTLLLIFIFMSNVPRYGLFAQLLQLLGDEVAPTAMPACLLSAASQQLDMAQYLIGCVHHQGTFGCNVDPEQAVRWLALAANQGLCQAMLLLGRIYAPGREFGDYLFEIGLLNNRPIDSGSEVSEVVGNRDEAIKWLRRGLKVACYTGDADMFTTAGLGLQVLGETVSRDDVDERAWGYFDLVVERLLA